ncbi:MAG: DNA repair exonuclease [Deltaproteobacteria bacterium]|nr:DNA repair exonuclease [Deltaproteobacteria bacterium]
MPFTSFSFIHCADLHLDSPFEGLHAVAPFLGRLLRDATFRAFDNVIDLALDEKVDFIIVAGDVYDAADRSLRAQTRFRDALGRAAAAGISCFVAHGNHDPLSGWEAGLEMAAGVHRFGGDAVERFVVERRGEPLAAIYGISYPVGEVRENLVPHFPQTKESLFAIGVLHANLGGDATGHDNYAPCTLEDLLYAPLDYWALGHVHTRQILRPGRPCVVYPGNTQGRSIREPEARGCYLVRVADDGHITPEFMATDVVRWHFQELDISGLSSLDELLAGLHRARDEARAASDGRGAVVRLHLTGRGDLHHDLRRVDPERDLAAVLREGEGDRPDFVFYESIVNRTRPALDLAQRRLVQDFVGDFLSAAEAIRQGDNPQETLREVLMGRPESRAMLHQLEQLNEAGLLEILENAETLGLDLLLPEEE